MTTYKGTKGNKILTLASDPPTPIAGQVWYNSTTYALKGALTGTVGAWASGGTLNTGRSGAGGFGTQTAAFVIGGAVGPPISSAFEIYDGTSWTTSPASLSVATYSLGCAGKGTATAGLSFGGKTTAVTGVTDSWNGTSWSEVAEMSVARQYIGGVGVQGDALATGGYAPPSTVTNVEKWNGTAWSEVAEMNSSRFLSGCACGVSTAAIAAGGYLQPASAVSALVETYNGTAWTEITELLTAKDKKSTFGIQTLAISVGGEPASALTESWNGTSWTEVADLATARYYMASSGSSSTAATVAGGGEAPSPGSVPASTEEWTVPDIVIKTVATS